jgi:hypothetical protein
MPREHHPGLLIVVNRYTEADETAATINKWAGADVAKAYHRKVKDVSGDLSPLAAFPILVICHRRLEYGLDQGSTRFDALFNFNGGRRRAVLIDEALEMVYMAKVSDSELRTLLATLPAPYRVKHTRAYDVLENFVRVMRQNIGTNRGLTAAQLLDGPGLSFAQAQGEVERMRHAVSADQRLDGELRQNADGLLSALLHQIDSNEFRWQHTNQREMETALHGHRLLAMPTGSRGLIMDATARLNYIYKSRPHEFRIVDVERARDHSHIKLLVAYGGETGRIAVKTEDKATKHAKQILTDVLAALGSGAKDKHVLIATHEVGEDAFKKSPLASRFASLSTCHWNAITGENQWGSCDVGVVATLPYLPLPADLSTAMAALEREMPDAELNGDLEELRQVRMMRMAAEVTQFIGRIQRSTDVAPVTVFLRLPDHRQQIYPDQLLALILETLQGARAGDWAGATRKTPRPGRGPSERDARGAAVAAYLGGLPKHIMEVPANQVREAVGASTSSWGRYLQTTTEVAGWRVVRPERAGNGRETVFVRQK